MRVVFMGTPDFAVPSLKALAAAGHEVPLVFTRPDAVRGRGKKLVPSPVKAAAEKLGIPVFETSRMTPEAKAALAEAAPDEPPAAVAPAPTQAAPARDVAAPQAAPAAARYVFEFECTPAQLERLMAFLRAEGIHGKRRAA